MMYIDDPTIIELEYKAAKTRKEAALFCTIWNNGQPSSSFNPYSRGEEIILEENFIFL